MKKIVFILLLYFLAISSGFAQLKQYSFEQIDSLQSIQKRKVIVFIYTDWCQFCLAMKKTTFKNKAVIDNLNSNFYFISFNAEEKRTVLFNNQSFAYKPSGNNVGIHELAIQLATLNNQLVYPSLCVLDATHKIIFQYSNYSTAAHFIKLLTDLNKI